MQRNIKINNLIILYTTLFELTLISQEGHTWICNQPNASVYKRLINHLHKTIVRIHAIHICNAATKGLTFVHAYRAIKSCEFL